MVKKQGKRKKGTGFYAPFSSARSASITRRLALQFFSAGLFRTQSLSDAVVEGDFSRIVNYELDLYDHDDVDRVRRTRAALALFSKNSSLRLGINTKRVAWEKFCKSEAICRSTNQRIWNLLRGCEPGVAPFFLMVQRKIAELLGPAPALSELNCRFGPGANTTVRAPTVGLRYKIRAPLACSTEMVPLLPELRELYPALFLDIEGNPREVEVMPGRYSVVPKNAKGGRSIIVEPILNTFVQLGIDDYVKDRLLTVGINLRSQRANQECARVGSIDGSYSTLDLSMASDTVASRIVVELYPPDWLDLLSSCRTGRVVSSFLKGKTFELAKFSSMGNGATFTLETVIFWAISAVATALSGQDPRLVKVYGDDIAVPRDAYEKVAKALRLCGFVINDDKSFSDGPFRESCGADYFRGIDVRPFFLEGRWTPARIISFCNFYTRNEWFSPHEIGWLLDELQEGHKLLGPDGFGDGHLISDDPGDLTPFGRDRGYHGYTFRTYLQKRQFDEDPIGLSDFRLPCASVAWNTAAGAYPTDQEVREARIFGVSRDVVSCVLSWSDPTVTRKLKKRPWPNEGWDYGWGDLRGSSMVDEVKRIYMHRPL